MDWKNKARIIKICSKIPIYGADVYKFIQKNFGRLDANPQTRIFTQIEMSQWILGFGRQIEDRVFFEVGTGHKPVVPIGFFLCGAKKVITADVNERLDYSLLRSILFWISKNNRHVRGMYEGLVGSVVLNDRLSIIQKLKNYPKKFLDEANIIYYSPADAANTSLPEKSVDFHLSCTVLEHIPRDTIKHIFVEAKRILKDSGIAIHFIDLSDHFEHQDKSISKINFLRFSEDHWQKIAGNEFAYCNRMRAVDFFKTI
jgi:hypothetical protein